MSAQSDTPDTPPFRYTSALAQDIELRWQDWWDEHGTFETPNPTGLLGDAELAAARGLMVDMHCDETDDPMSRHIETLTAETQRLGLRFFGCLAEDAQQRLGAGEAQEQPATVLQLNLDRGKVRLVLAVVARHVEDDVAPAVRSSNGRKS